MKIAALIGVLCSLITAPAMAVTISFSDSLAGVDGDTSGWSTDDNVVQLNTSYSLLGGHASVSGFQDGLFNDLSHRLTRGLGVWDAPDSPIPAENDEIDNLGGTEVIAIDFDSPYVVNSIELRSLFADSNTDYFGRPTPVEQAMILFYHNGSLVHTSFVSGTGTLGVDDGEASISYPTGIVADEVVFQVPTSADLGLTPVDHDDDPYTFTDYAVSKLDVTPAPAPEPLTTSLGLMGLAALGLALRRRGSGN